LQTELVHRVINFDNRLSSVVVRASAIEISAIFDEAVELNAIAKKVSKGLVINHKIKYFNKPALTLGFDFSFPSHDELIKDEEEILCEMEEMSD